MAKEKFGREEILRAAAEVVRERGEESLTARAVAEKLAASTQPVYSCFGGMEELRASLVEEAKRQYHVRIEACLSTAKVRYAAYGMGFVRFAAEEKGLFRLLFLRDSPAEPFRDPFFEEIVAEMVKSYRMDEARARRFHADMSVFSYGLAVLVYTGNLPHDEAAIAEAYNREFYALYAYYFPERPHFWESTKQEGSDGAH